ncbi:MAG: HAD-IC family P-type ATPase, partial [Oscillospiraceae bacterium]|nr:HAD-IC family P-type ATPase [Oscillospiraceae bacterium]
MKHHGLTAREVEESRKKHGANTLTQIPPDPLWKKILEGFKDPMIMILLVALVVQVVLFFLHQAEWFEPVGILIAIMIANGVSAVSENKQEGKASALKAEEEAKETAKVLRDGKLEEIHVSEVVVGDIVFLQAGDKLPADGEIVEGEVKVDQAALNGETEEAEKVPGTSYDIKDLLNKHYAYRGTVVCGGEAYVEIKVVGDATLFGQLALEVQEDTRETPLQVKLSKLAKQISTFGYIGAIAIVIGIMAKTLLTGDFPDDIYEWVRLIMNAITVAVTIIVCAVPEGLPMLTSILLSFQSLKMAKDNVLVRKINGLETAGSLSILFSDKTGTITEGRLSVVELATGGTGLFSGLDTMPAGLRADVVAGAGINNSAAASDGNIIGGNSTDRALIGFLMAAGAAGEIDKSGVVRFNAFDSAKKYSSVVLEKNGETVTYIKGAPEKILANCTRYIDETGAVKPFTDPGKLTAYIDAQAGRSMRLLAVAKADGLG